MSEALQPLAGGAEPQERHATQASLGCLPSYLAPLQSDAHAKPKKAGDVLPCFKWEQVWQGTESEAAESDKDQKGRLGQSFGYPL